MGCGREISVGGINYARSLAHSVIAGHLIVTGELLGEFETIYPPQLCGGMYGAGGATPMPTVCTSINATMPNRAVYLSQYKRGRAEYMIFVSHCCQAPPFLPFPDSQIVVVPRYKAR